MEGNLKNKKGITLIALVITIVVLLILASVSIAMLTGDNGIITKAQEATFRTEMAQIREMVDMHLLEKEMNVTETSIKMNEVPIEKAKKWELTLKKEIIHWGNYDIEINKPTDYYIEEMFDKIVLNESGDIGYIYYIESNDLDSKKGKEKYIYNSETDIIYKLKKTGVGRHTVHSIEELDFLMNGGVRSKDQNKNYTKISYDVEFKQVGNISCYEPDLNGLGQEVTNLIFYKSENGNLTSEYSMPFETWINKGKPSKIVENNNEYILYDYENQIWANIRIKSGSVETNWTWIPRYSFTNGISNTTNEVKFLQTTDSPETNYQLAPAFEGNEKKGIWISKYEPTYKVQTDPTYYSYYIPDLSNLNKENTYIEIYNKETGKFEREVKASEVENLAVFSQNNLWFDYDNKIWANIKIVENGIETWWVWIPRYAHSSGSNNTEIKFIDINNKPLDGSELSAYEVAGAFEGNNKKGIWISKYEPSTISQNLTENAPIPNLEGFDREKTFIEIYNKETGKFEKEVQLSTIKDLEKFAKENLWFDYKNKIWANIKVVENGVETWWVWIPRYAHNNGSNTTDILLVTTDNKTLNGEDIPVSYSIADPFIGNDKKGMWVSKYEPTEK